MDVKIPRGTQVKPSHTWDKVRVSYLGVHVRAPFCLFGHVTPHGPIRDALDGYTSSTSPVTLQKTDCGECPLYYCYRFVYQCVIYYFVIGSLKQDNANPREY